MMFKNEQMQQFYVDGMPAMDQSYSGKNFRGQSTSKYFLNDEEDDKISSVSEIILGNDESKFIKIYNKQGHYSASQSVMALFPFVKYLQ